MIVMGTETINKTGITRKLLPEVELEAVAPHSGHGKGKSNFSKVVSRSKTKVGLKECVQKTRKFPELNKEV